MHTMWKGAISFGLVHVPIKLYAATEDKDVRLRQLHKECKSPIKQEKVCPVCNKTLTAADIVKGFEIAPDHFVILTEEDLKAMEQKSDHEIEIIDFVHLSEVDPVYYHKSYFIGTGEGGGNAFTLLYEALKQTEKIGIGKITLRNKQQLCIIRPYQNVLILETIYWPDEVRASTQIPGVSKERNIVEKELDIAKQLIEHLTKPFDPSVYKDESREQMTALIESKQATEIAKPEQPKNVINLMEALQASLAQAASEAKPKRTRSKTTKKTS